MSSQHYKDYPVQLDCPNGETIELLCEFYYYFGGFGYDAPPEIDLRDVTAGGVDVSHDLSSNQWEYIESIILEEMLTSNN